MHTSNFGCVRWCVSLTCISPLYLLWYARVVSECTIPMCTVSLLQHTLGPRGVSLTCGLSLFRQSLID
ncbi:Uncharacterized protein TCM_010144 [Theobroma cacao]|uniref:Uncharacterized protein n=1 Tax=Theobroma cacao TaxID=3641 RepID=A0A061E6Q5_THECC|nr:Uncharacterized protein TCM_010144 [Theobroma cacao]